MVARGTATPTGQRSPMRATPVMNAAWMRSIFRQQGAWSARERTVKKFSPEILFYFILFSRVVATHAPPGAPVQSPLRGIFDAAARRRGVRVLPRVRQKF